MQTITGKDGVLAPLLKQLTEAALEADVETHLAHEFSPNRRGKSTKTIKSSSGSFELETSRDRAGTFEPHVIKKRQTHVNDLIESKMLSMYGLGMSYCYKAEYVEEMYGFSVSPATISAITDKIIDQFKQRHRDHWTATTYLSGSMQFTVRSKKNGEQISKAVYTVLGLTLEGKKGCTWFCNYPKVKVLISGCQCSQI